MRSKARGFFGGMARWAYSSTSAKFGLKMHLVVNRKQKIRNFALTPGSVRDVSCAEDVLKNFRETIIGDKGCSSSPLVNRLQVKDI
ncbi:MAG: transposase [Puniceicoccales bacterium]|jgi:hypothetical protein|nr:transposase [Puniceicoccales bacterium]